MNLPLLSESVGVSFPGLGIIDLPVSRVAFQIGSFPVYWYGICIILAFAGCVGLAMLQANKHGFTSDDVIDYTLVIIPAAIIGARLYYVAFAWDVFKDNPLTIFDIRNGGLAVLGGFLLSILAVYIMARVKKQRVANVLDFWIVYVPLGQAIGRWGNFFNQEAFGTNTTLPWGMISSETTAFLKAFAPDLDPNAPVHPTFLYESLACLLIFAILMISRNKIKLPFAMVSMYFIGYGTARFFIEGLRTDSLFIGNTGLRSSQVLSAVLVIFGFAMIALSRYLKLTPMPVHLNPLEKEEGVDDIDILTARSAMENEDLAGDTKDAEKDASKDTSASSKE